MTYIVMKSCPGFNTVAQKKLKKESILVEAPNKLSHYNNYREVTQLDKKPKTHDRVLFEPNAPIQHFLEDITHNNNKAHTYKRKNEADKPTLSIFQTKSVDILAKRNYSDLSSPVTCIKQKGTPTTVKQLDRKSSIDTDRSPSYQSAFTSKKKERSVSEKTCDSATLTNLSPLLKEYMGDSDIWTCLSLQQEACMSALDKVQGVLLNYSRSYANTSLNKCTV